MRETIGYVLIAIGVLFDFFGCVGLVRLPDLYNRLQAATKCVTLGTISILLGALVMAGVSALGIKAVICAVFIVITSPTAAHALARGAHASGVRLWEKSVVDKYLEDGQPGLTKPESK
ncbi:MAG: monovalent cation/H(+) antiporter subunit G [Verrucomicrobiota bacterium]